MCQGPYVRICATYRVNLHPTESTEDSREDSSPYTMASPLFGCCFWPKRAAVASIAHRCQKVRFKVALKGAEIARQKAEVSTLLQRRERRRSHDWV